MNELRMIGHALSWDIGIILGGIAITIGACYGSWWFFNDHQAPDLNDEHQANDDGMVKG